MSSKRIKATGRFFSENMYPFPTIQNITLLHVYYPQNILNFPVRFCIIFNIIKRKARRINNTFVPCKIEYTARFSSFFIFITLKFHPAYSNLTTEFFHKNLNTNKIIQFNYHL